MAVHHVLVFNKPSWFVDDNRVWLFLFLTHSLVFPCLSIFGCRCCDFVLLLFPSFLPSTFEYLSQVINGAFVFFVLAAIQVQSGEGGVRAHGEH